MRCFVRRLSGGLSNSVLVLRKVAQLRRGFPLLLRVEDIQ